MLPKLTGLYDAHLFLRKLEEVYSMIYFPNIFVDVVGMKLIPFALKEATKRYIYGWLLIYYIS